MGRSKHNYGSKDKIFDELQEKLLEASLKDNAKANSLRTLFEKVLRMKLDIPADDNTYYKLQDLWCDYIRDYRPENVQYTGNRIIADFNKFSHYTPDIYSEGAYRSDISRLLKIFNVVFGTDYSFENLEKETETIPSNLNEAQLKAVNSESRITVVNAGPGTGKTHLIVDRIIKSCQLNNKQRVVALAYTNQAAITLKERFEYKIFNTNYFSFLDRAFIGTIHAYAFHLMKSYTEELKKESFLYEIIDEDEYLNIRQEFNHHEKLTQEFLKSNNLWTFEKILSQFNGLIKNDPDFANYAVTQSGEIIIDEAQDLNKLQYEIFHRLFEGSKSTTLFFVGDQRQNIFGFRGGSIKNLSEEFGTDNIGEYNLEISYRCPDRVLRFVNTFQFSDCKNPALNNPKFKGEPIIKATCDNKSAEAQQIGSLITSLTESNTTFNQMAILAPSTYYFDAIGYDLNSREIPFKVFGGKTHLNRHIRFLISLLQAVSKLNLYPVLKVVSFWEPKFDFKGLSGSQIVSHILDSTNGYEQRAPELYHSVKFISLTKEEELDLDSTITNFGSYCEEHNIFAKEIIDLFKQFQRTLIQYQIDNINDLKAKISPNQDGFDQFYIKSAGVKCESTVENSFVALSTIHSAKGREWDHVIIPGLTQDLFPKFNSDLNEELKKFYVACTRAAKSLYLLRPKKYEVPNKRGGPPHVFRKEESIFLDSLKEYGTL